MEKNDYKIIATVAVGGLIGLIIGNYIWKVQTNDVPLSQRISGLSKIIEQLEGIDTKEAEDLKERIKNIILTLESNYGNSKE